jgi:predicted RND superfamily exporter protein
MAPDSSLISRKFIYAILITILGFLLVVFHQVKPEDWFSFVQVVGGIYVIGNIADKIALKQTPLG